MKFAKIPMATINRLSVYSRTLEELLENEDVKEFYLGVKEESVRGYKRWKRKKKWR